MTNAQVITTKSEDYDAREFRFEDKVWADPEPALTHSLSSIIDYLSQAHPAIRQAGVTEKVETRKGEDGEDKRYLVVTFVKKATTKALSGEDLAAVLIDLAPVDVKAIHLMERLTALQAQAGEDRDLPLGPLLDMATEIREGLDGLSEMVRLTQKTTAVVCLSLPAAPSFIFED